MPSVPHRAKLNRPSVLALCSPSANSGRSAQIRPAPMFAPKRVTSRFGAPCASPRSIRHFVCSFASVMTWWAAATARTMSWAMILAALR